MCSLNCFEHFELIRVDNIRQGKSSLSPIWWWRSRFQATLFLKKLHAFASDWRSQDWSKCMKRNLPCWRKYSLCACRVYPSHPDHAHTQQAVHGVSSLTCSWCPCSNACTSVQGIDPSLCLKNIARRIWTKSACITGSFQFLTLLLETRSALIYNPIVTMEREVINLPKKICCCLFFKSSLYRSCVM